jgi:UDP-glucose 4-epimerase
MRVAVTGTTGLIGSAVARLLRDNHEVVAAGRGPDADVRLDLSDPAAIRAAQQVPFDALVHCAGIVDEDFKESPERAQRHATDGTTELVRWARACGAQRIGYISSAHVYGPLLGHLDENTVPQPQSPYAHAHLASEQIVAGSGAMAALFRPCAVFGVPPDLARFRRWALTPFSFPRDGLIQGEIVLRSSGLQRRNFVAASDIARSVATWLNQPAPPLVTAINTVGPTTMSMWEFANICASTVQEVTGRPCQARRLENSPASAEAEFDYETIFPKHRGSVPVSSAMQDFITLLENTLKK